MCDWVLANRDWIFSGLGIFLISGITSVLTFCLGFIISEVVRRINRAEMINVQIFDKRLEIYHKFRSLINRTYKAKIEFHEHLKSGEYEPEYIAQKYNEAVIALMEFMDDNSLFISEELGVHCMTTFVSHPEEYSEIEQCERELSEDYKSIIQMLHSESGMKMLNKSMKKMLKYQHKSEYISYFQQQRKGLKKKSAK